MPDDLRAQISGLVAAIRPVDEREAFLRPDPREYKGIGWFALDGQPGWPADVYDPEMHRFAGKLGTAR